MSDLRDLTNALAAISKSLTSIETHVADQNANCAQLRLGLHDLRNTLQTQEMERGEREKALAQIQTWMGSFSKKQAELSDSISNLQSTVHDGFRSDHRRLRALESDDEATQA